MSPKSRGPSGRSALEPFLSTRFLALFLLATIVVAALTLACGDDDGDGPQPTSTDAGTPGEGTEAPDGPALIDENLEIVETVSGLNSPTQMVFLAENDLLVTEKNGRVVRVREGQVEGPVLELAANFADERGVLGIALHPEFDANNYVYIYWTWTGVGQPPEGLLGEPSEDIEQVPELGNRVDRFTWDGERLTFDRNIIELPSRTTDLTLDRRRGNHDAGVIKFGPDGKLYVVMGDQNERGQLQNVADGPPPQHPQNTLAVVLRLNDDGSVPDDNPFVSAGPDVAPIFVYGVRNSFGYDFDPETGEFWLQTNGQASYDQLSRYTAGANLGWIQLMGPPDRFPDYKERESAHERALDAPAFPPDRLANSGDEAVSRLVLLEGATYQPPLLSWQRAVAPAAVGFVDGAGLGEDYDGDLLVGDVNTGSIYHFELSDDRMSLALEGGLADGVNDNAEGDPVGELADNIFATGMFVGTDIKTAPDGTVWIASLANGELYHIAAR